MPEVTLSSRQRREVLVLMCTALAVVVAATISLNIALPSFASDTGATQTQLTWVVDSYLLVFAALLLPAGALADRFGRREVLVGGLAIFAVAALATAFVDSTGAVIALRVLSAIGAAAVMPSTLSILTNSFPPEERSKAVGAWAGVAGGGGVLGMLIAGGLLEISSWRAIFVVNGALAVAALIPIAIRVPTSRDPSATRIDLVGVLLSVAGLAAVVYGVIEAPNHGWTSLTFLGTVIGGCVLLAGFVAWSLRVENPLLDPRLFRSPGFASGSLAITMQFFAIFAFQFVSLQYLQSVLGFSALAAGAALLPIAVMLMTLAPRAPRLADRFGMRAVVVAGSLLIVAAFVIFAQLQVDSSYLHYLAGTLVLGIGMALGAVPATTAILDSLPPSHQGVASAVNDTTREVGGALGIAVLGSLLNQGYRSTIDARLADVDQLRNAARPSLQVAAQTAGELGPRGQRVLETAQDAFVHGLHIAFYSGAGAVLLGTLCFLLIAPRRASRNDRAPALEHAATITP